MYSEFYYLATSVVLLTPSPANPGKWAKGVLANQWYPQAGGDFSGDVGTSASENGSDSLARILALASSKEFYMKDGTLTMTNNVPYGWQAEDTGWARTKAYHMVAHSINASRARFL